MGGSGWSKGEVCESCIDDVIDYFLHVPASLTPKEKQVKQELLAHIKDIDATIKESNGMCPVIYTLPGDKKKILQGKVVEKCEVNGWSGWNIMCSKFGDTEIKHGNLQHSVSTKDILSAGRRRLINQVPMDRLLR